MYAADVVLIPLYFGSVVILGRVLLWDVRRYQRKAEGRPKHRLEPQLDADPKNNGGR